MDIAMRFLPPMPGMPILQRLLGPRTSHISWSRLLAHQGQPTRPLDDQCSSTYFGLLSDLLVLDTYDGMILASLRVCRLHSTSNLLFATFTTYGVELASAASEAEITRGAMTDMNELNDRLYFSNPLNERGQSDICTLSTHTTIAHDVP